MPVMEIYAQIGASKYIADRSFKSEATIWVGLNWTGSCNAICKNSWAQRIEHGVLLLMLVSWWFAYDIIGTVKNLIDPSYMSFEMSKSLNRGITATKWLNSSEDWREQKKGK